MHIVGRAVLDDFVRRHADARSWIENWILVVQSAHWRSPGDLKRSFASASFLAGNIVYFNVKGNRYRLEAQVAYAVGVVNVRWMGTHAAYDRRGA